MVFPKSSVISSWVSALLLVLLVLLAVVTNSVILWAAAGVLIALAALITGTRLAGLNRQ